MRVRVLSDLSFHDGRYQSGAEVTLPDEKAKQLVDAGLCEEVVEVVPAAPVEAAALAEAPETAVIPKARKRG